MKIEQGPTKGQECNQNTEEKGKLYIIKMLKGWRSERQRSLKFKRLKVTLIKIGVI